MVDALPFTVTTGTYKQHVHGQGPDVIYMNRNQFYRCEQSQIDAYGEHWIFAYADMKPDQVFIRHQNESIPLVGPWCAVIAHYAIVEWQLKEGEVEWNAMTSVEKSLPEGLRGKVIIFPWNGSIPKSIEDVLKMVRESDQKLEIESQRKTSAIALKTKNFIDDNYSEALLIESVAERLGLSWAVMTREFKKTYGVSPVEYRHKIRVFKAVRKLSAGLDVTSSLAESGFTSASQFFELFKKYLGTQPKSFHYKIKPERSLTLSPNTKRRSPQC